jgi:general secretion pathway protein F
MVRVAESSGSLDSVLESVGEERARMDGLLDKISASLRYPIFLLLVAVGVLTFFMLVVVPQFAATLRDFGPPPTGLVGFILAASDFMVRNSVALGLGVVVAGVAIAAILVQPRYRAVLAEILMRVPVIRDIVSLRRTVLFCSSLGTLLTNGVTLTAALGVIVDLPGASAATMDAVIEGVRRGGRLVDALSKTSYIPPLALKMLRVGEESGELAIVARRTAEFYQSKLSDRLDHLASIIGPAAIVIIAGLIGTLIVSILSALLSMNQLVG